MAEETALDTLAELIGPAATAALAERLGGTMIYIPTIPAPGSRLVLAIGHGAAARLCDAMPGSVVRVPSRTSQERVKRRAAIAYDLRRGLSVGEVATRHGVTDKHVRALRAQQEQNPCP
jgi:hypothetical protein